MKKLLALAVILLSCSAHAVVTGKVMSVNVDLHDTNGYSSYVTMYPPPASCPNNVLYIFQSTSENGRLLIQSVMSMKAKGDVVNFQVAPMAISSSKGTTAPLCFIYGFNW